MSQAETGLTSVLLQLIVMIVAARIAHTVFQKLNQPGVVGEILAGLLLGPSVMGHYFPGVFSEIFNGNTSATVSIVGQIGLMLLMFQVGAQFELTHVKGTRIRVVIIGIASLSVAVPLALGLLIGWLSAPSLAPEINPVPYCLFCGVAMAITALPVLGRIMLEFGLAQTKVGIIAISAAVLNDLVGWILLAGVLACVTARFDAADTAVQLGGLALFVVALWLIFRPALDWAVRRFPLRHGGLPPNLMAVLICLMLVAGICSSQLGVFAIFGAFAAGVLLERQKAIVAAWQDQVGGFVLVFFMPVFFTYTGLRTNVLWLSPSDLWWLTIILAVACLGKIAPVYVSSRLFGLNRQDSSLLGILMNTRGLMELVVLNIGYDLGYLPPKVFTMLVIMAVTTTMMTGVFLNLLLKRRFVRQDERSHALSGETDAA